MWIRFWPKKPDPVFSYFWCQTFHKCPRFRKPAWIRIQGSRVYKGRLIPKVWKQKRRLSKLSTIFFNGILKISLRFRYKPLDPVFFLPKTDPYHFRQLNCLKTNLKVEAKNGITVVIGNLGNNALHYSALYSGGQPVQKRNFRKSLVSILEVTV